MKHEFEAHYEESAQHPMKFRYAVHNFTGGRPGLANVFRKFLEYAKSHEGVWFCTCSEMARFWRETQARELPLDSMGTANQVKGFIDDRGAEDFAQVVS